MTRSQWFILTSAILWLGFMAGVAAYEQSVFDWHFAREEAPVHDGWHWARRLVTAGLSFLLVAALAQARGRLGADGAPQRIDLSGLQLGAAGWGGIIAAIRGSAELAELTKVMPFGDGVAAMEASGGGRKDLKSGGVPDDVLNGRSDETTAVVLTTWRTYYGTITAVEENGDVLVRRRDVKDDKDGTVVVRRSRDLEQVAERRLEPSTGR